MGTAKNKLVEMVEEEARKRRELEIADDIADARKAIAEYADEWVNVNSIPAADYELETEANRIHEDICPCSYGICDEVGACPLHN